MMNFVLKRLQTLLLIGLALLLVGMGFANAPTASAAGGTGGPTISYAFSNQILQVLPSCRGFLGTSTDDIIYAAHAEPPYWESYLANIYGATKSLYRDGVFLRFLNFGVSNGSAPVAINQAGGAWDYETAIEGTHTYRIDTTYDGIIQYNGDLNQYYALGQPHYGPQPTDIGTRTFTGNTFTYTHTLPDGCFAGTGGGGTPPAEVCGDGIDNNGNGQIDENCQSQTITLNQPTPSCVGSNPQIALDWSSTVTERNHQLASKDNAGLGEALRDLPPQSDISNQIATLPPIDLGGGGGNPGGIIYSVYRDGLAITSTQQNSFIDTAPLSGSHIYNVSAVNSSFVPIQSGNQSVDTASCNLPNGNPTPLSGISVRINGQGTGLKLNHQYPYSADVIDNATGQPISGGSTSGGTPAYATTINFDDVSAYSGSDYVTVGVEKDIPQTQYQNKGILIDSLDAYSNANNDNYHAPAGGGGIYYSRRSSAACGAFVAASSAPNTLGHSGNFGWAPIRITFVNGQVVDDLAFALWYAGNSNFEVRAFDTNNNEIPEARKTYFGTSGVCTSANINVPLNKGASTGISYLEVRKTTNGSTNTFGIDDLKFTTLHSPGASTTNGANVNWSLEYNRIGAGTFNPLGGARTFNPPDTSPSPSTTTMTTTSLCSVLDQNGDASDIVVAAVTATINGQTFNGTASLPVAMHDAPCGNPPPPPPPTNGVTASIKAPNSNGQCVNTAPATLKRGKQYTYCASAQVNGQEIPVIAPGSVGGGGTGGSGGIAAISTVIDFNDLPDRIASGGQISTLYNDKGIANLGNSIIAPAIQDLGNGQCQDYIWSGNTQSPGLDPITKQPLPPAPAPTQYALGLGVRPSADLRFTGGQVADQISFRLIDSGGSNGNVRYDALDASGNATLGITGFLRGSYCMGSPTIVSNAGGIGGIRFSQVGSGQTLGPDFVAIDDYGFSPLHAPGSGSSGGGSGPVPNGGTYAQVVSGTWSVDSAVGTLNTAANELTTQLTTGQTNRASGDVSVRLNVYINNVLQPAAFGRLRVIINDPNFLKTLGDIFGFTGVNGISVGAGSIVTSSQTICVNREGQDGCSSQLTIPGYTPKLNLDWNAIHDPNGATIRGIRRLAAESSKLTSQSAAVAFASGVFNLNPKKKGDPTDANNNDTNPEGAVWHVVAGDLNIPPNATFKGRGTIIVDGKVNVLGSVSYQNGANDMLGIISLDSDPGDKISFSPIQATCPQGGCTLVGAYFAPFASSAGSASSNAGIKFGANLASALGIFVGDTIDIDPSLDAFSVIYDGRITKNPPPGFRQSFVPSLGETAP